MYSSALSVKVFSVKMINLSTKLAARFWNLKILNVGVTFIFTSLNTGWNNHLKLPPYILRIRL